MEKKRQFKRHVIAAVGDIKETFDEKLAKGNTTIKMALQFGVSRNVLQEAFRDFYGCGIRDYKLQQRMEVARLLLEQGKDVKQVSLEVNYATQSGFSSAFKKYYRITPSQFINGYKRMTIYEMMQSRKK